MRILPIPCLKDNYAYLIVGDTGDAAIVDASEAEPVRLAVLREGVKVRAIWSTHHHWDHVGGNEELAKEWGVEVTGHASDRSRLPGLVRGLETGDTARAGELE